MPLSGYWHINESSVLAVWTVVKSKLMVWYCIESCNCRLFIVLYLKSPFLYVHSLFREEKLTVSSFVHKVVLESHVVVVHSQDTHFQLVSLIDSPWFFKYACFCGNRVVCLWCLWSCCSCLYSVPALFYLLRWMCAASSDNVLWLWVHPRMQTSLYHYLCFRVQHYEILDHCNSLSVCLSLSCSFSPSLIN